MGLVIGSLRFLTDLPIASAQKEHTITTMVEDAIKNGSAVVIDPCFGLKSEAIPVQTPQGPGITMFRQAMPLANLQGPAKLRTIITGVLLFSEMEELEQRRHKGLVEQLMAQLTAARAEAAGIQLAKPGDLPVGQRRP